MLQNKNWQIKTLNDVSKKLSLNKLKIKQKEYLPSGLYPVIDQGQDLIGGYFNDKSLLVSDEPPYIIFGDHTKVKKYITFKFIPGADGVKVLKAKENILPKFLFYLLFTIKIEDKGYARHFQLLEKESFLIPNDIETQKAIVSKIEELFSELDKGIEDLKTAQQQLKTYRQSVLKWAFEGKLTNENVKDGKLPKGWEIKTLGEVCFTTSGGTPSRRNLNYYNGVIPWVKSGELNKGIIYNTEEKITEEAIKNSSAKIFPKGTLLIALYGATIGKLAFLGVEAATNQAICGIFENKNISSYYLYYFLAFNKSKLVEQGIGGAQPNISQAILKSLKIPIAPLEEQHLIFQEIESRWTVADKMEESITQSLQQAEALRQSILKKAFSGELV
ncbi:MAG: restriction endonuclease subunit S [Flavobacterium sp.]|nr:restriction endonuclease subunit S [Flavobacterium sp.]